MELHEKRRCKCVEHTGAEAWHGLSGYTNHYCRCETCTTANRDRRRTDRAADPGKYRDRERAYRARRPEVIRESHRKWRVGNLDYDRRRTRSWNAENPLATAAASRRDARVRDEIRSRASAHRRRWTKAEDDALLRSNASSADMASALGRSVVAVRHRRAKLRGVA